MNPDRKIEIEDRKENNFQLFQIIVLEVIKTHFYILIFEHIHIRIEI